jgi:hypothetical protein
MVIKASLSYPLETDLWPTNFWVTMLTPATIQLFQAVYAYRLIRRTELAVCGDKLCAIKRDEILQFLREDYNSAREVLQFITKIHYFYGTGSSICVLPEIPPQGATLNWINPFGVSLWSHPLLP